MRKIVIIFLFLIGTLLFAQDFEEVKRNAEQGNSVAQFSLGLMYFNGDGVPVNKREAFKWFKRSAEQGNPIAQGSLGLMYYNGEDVLVNKREALRWV